MVYSQVGMHLVIHSDTLSWHFYRVLTVGSERLSLIKKSLYVNIALTETSCLLLPGRMCDASSYKPWSPGVSETKNDTCLLGEQEVIERKNPNAFCFNGREYERVTDTKICKCVHADYEW